MHLMSRILPVLALALLLFLHNPSEVGGHNGSVQRRMGQEMAHKDPFAGFASFRVGLLLAGHQPVWQDLMVFSEVLPVQVMVMFDGLRQMEHL